MFFFLLHSSFIFAFVLYIHKSVNGEGFKPLFLLTFIAGYFGKNN